MLGGLQGGRGAGVEQDVSLLEGGSGGARLEVVFERGAAGAAEAAGRGGGRDGRCVDGG